MSSRCCYCGEELEKTKINGIHRCCQCSLLQNIKITPKIKSIYGKKTYFEGGEASGYSSYDLMGYVNYHYKVKLSNWLSANKQSRLLDVGCATGEFISYLNKNISSFGVDISQYAISRALRRGLDVKLLDLEIDSLSDKYNIITAWDFIEHILDLRKVLDKLLGALHEDGYLIMSTPDSTEKSEAWSGYESSHEHATFWNHQFINKIKKDYSSFDIDSFSVFNGDTVVIIIKKGKFTNLELKLFLKIKSGTVDSKDRTINGLVNSVNITNKIFLDEKQSIEALDPDSSIVNGYYREKSKNYQSNSDIRDKIFGDTGIKSILMKEDLKNEIMHYRLNIKKVREDYAAASKRIDKLEGYIYNLTNSRKIALRNFFNTIRASRNNSVLMVDRSRKLIIYPPTTIWNTPLFQRPHQILTQFAKNGYLVIFITKDAKRDQVNGYRQVAENIYVVESLNNVKGFFRPYLYITWANSVDYISKIKTSKIIYEYMDELDVFAGYGPEYIKKHRRLLKVSDVVTCTADTLYEDAKKIRKRKIILSPNAVDESHFKRTDNAPKDLQKIIEKRRPIIGYYGALAKWFDYDLLKKIANKTKYEYVLLGYDYDGSMKKAGIDKIDNIHYLGVKNYDDLPHYSSFFDVSIIPFKVNKVTKSTSPVKLFEYMAIESPIVTTALDECKKYKSVIIANSQKDFVRKLELALSKKDDKGYKNQLKKDAKNNTWQRRVEEIEEVLSD